MRIWSKQLIPFLPNAQINGQWKEIGSIKAAIEKKGTPNHLLVNKVLDYSIEHFKEYAELIYHEGKKRGFAFTKKKLDSILEWESYKFNPYYNPDELYMGWHETRYLRQCLFNLQEKADCGGVKKDEWSKIFHEFGGLLK